MTDIESKYIVKKQAGKAAFDQLRMFFTVRCGWRASLHVGQGSCNMRRAERIFAILGQA